MVGWLKVVGLMHEMDGDIRGMEGGLYIVT